MKGIQRNICSSLRSAGFGHDAGKKFGDAGEARAHSYGFGQN